MRFRSMAAATALSLFLFAGLCTAQDLDTKALDDMVAAARKDWDVPGLAVAIVAKDKLVYAKGEGVCELGTQLQVTADTLFAIGSITKQITAMLIAMLVGEGKMDWDDPVSRHIPFFKLSDPTADKDVTIRDLLCHRTGMPRYDNVWAKPLEREELLKRLATLKPTKPFRADYQYNNLMFVAAGYAAGKADNSSWEELVQQRILTPLGMTGATLSVKTMQNQPDFARPHDAKGKAAPARVPFRDIDHVGPAGSINASVRDMSQWLRFLLAEGELDSKRLVPLKHVREVLKPHILVPRDGSATDLPDEFSVLKAYALGIGVRDYRGHKLFEHGGAIDGFKAQMFLMPSANAGLIVLCNRGGFAPQALGYQLVDRMLELPQYDWKEHFQGKKKKL